MTKCKRKGCERPASRYDEFCGTICAKLYFGTLAFDPDASKKRRARKRKARLLKAELEVAKALGIQLYEETDAMAHRVPGSYGTGRRQQRGSVR